MDLVDKRIRKEDPDTQCHLSFTCSTLNLKSEPKLFKKPNEIRSKPNEIMRQGIKHTFYFHCRRYGWIKRSYNSYYVRFHFDESREFPFYCLESNSKVV